MLGPSVFLALSAMTGLSSAYSIDPNSVNITTREAWCQAQRNSCLLICGTSSVNTCDSNSLAYNCTCQSGDTPNLANYIQTIPYFECEQYVDDCVAANTSSASNQQECLAIGCGELTAGASSSTSSSSTVMSSTTSKAASSTTAGASSTSGSGSPTAAATHTGAAAAIAMARDYGTPALAAGVLAAFGLAI